MEKTILMPHAPVFLKTKSLSVTIKQNSFFFPNNQTFWHF